MDWSDPTYTALRAAITAEDLVRQRIVRRLTDAARSAQLGRYDAVADILASDLEDNSFPRFSALLGEARQRGTEVALRENAIRRKASRMRKVGA